MKDIVLIGGVVVGVLVLLPFIVSTFLRDVEAGTVRLVSWLQGSTMIYRGPGKSKEIPLLTTGTTISSKVINVDLDITDQTADVDESGRPQPIKIRVLASAIVSVGDSDVMVRTAANRSCTAAHVAGSMIRSSGRSSTMTSSSGRLTGRRLPVSGSLIHCVALSSPARRVTSVTRSAAMKAE